MTQIRMPKAALLCALLLAHATAMAAERPLAAIVVSPKPNAAGWNREPVSVKFDCSKSIVKCPPAIHVSSEGVQQEVGATVVDRAGHASRVSTVVNIDRTPPMLSVMQPAAGTLLYDTTVHLVGKVSDALSGLQSIACNEVAAQVSGDAFTCDVPLTIGTHHVRVWATDTAGNVTTIKHRIVIGPMLPGGDQHEARVDVDLDGDGRLDSVRTDFMAGAVIVTSHRADGSIAEQRIEVGPYPSALAVADIDGDGVLDLITTHYTEAAVAVHLGQRDGSYRSGPRFQVDRFPSAIAAADLNGDGRVDLITAHLHNREVHVHLAERHGKFDTKPSVEAGIAPVA